jgi:hypothetical protein
MDGKILGFVVEKACNDFHDNKEEKEDPRGRPSKIEIPHSSEVRHGFADLNPIVFMRVIQLS